MGNEPKTKEQTLQKFFERYPHFFRRWDYREVCPHVYLTRDDENQGPLIPDFILTNRDAMEAFVVDLKLPSAKIVRNQRNRRRFSACVLEAKAQLLEYSRWFEHRLHRERLREIIGMSIYRPQLAVVIGRSDDFTDELDRQRLRDSEVSIVTYDDILEMARRRMRILHPNI